MVSEFPAGRLDFDHAGAVSDGDWELTRRSAVRALFDVN
jgi:hypothetical protein